MPLNERNAAAILKQMGGPAAPDEWQGGLPMTYRIGPGPVTLEMDVRNDERVEPMRSVIGVIRGREEPEKLVILGNHHDAWIYGAVDPSSGTAAILEVARALGEAVKKGYRPRRTIVFTVWDGEEALLGGSTQWALDNAENLRKNAVVYINVDSAVQGGDFVGGATPALAKFLLDLTKTARDPLADRPLYDAWAASAEGGVPEVETIVGATDYTAFQEYLGISCVDMYFDGPYGVYHSMYDNHNWVARIGDPGFRYHAALVNVWGIAAMRLANADALPIDPAPYAQRLREFLADVRRRPALNAAAARKDVEPALREVESAVEALRVEADGFNRRRDLALQEPDSRTLDALNRKALGFERAFLSPGGIPGRPWYQHLVYAPKYTYAPELLPGISEAIEEGAWARAAEQGRALAAAIRRAAALLREE
jgi:N-acetylated-alpha-linked acidic dipeptidase